MVVVLELLTGDKYVIDPGDATIYAMSFWEVGLLAKRTR